MVNKKTKTILLILAVLVSLGILLIFAIRGKKEDAGPAPMIISTTPQNNSPDVVGDSNMEIVFDQGVTEKDRDEVSLKFEPAVRFTEKWVSENRLEISFPDNLRNDTDYKASVYYNDNKIKELNFKTDLFSEEEFEQMAEGQAADDMAFAETILEIYEKMPWLNKLPIETDEYVMVYDFDKESIRIRLLIPESSSEQTKTAAQQKALNELENAGVNAEEITYYFMYLE